MYVRPEVCSTQAMKEKTETVKKTEHAREKMKMVVPSTYSHVRHIIILSLLTLSPVPFFIWALFAWGVPATALLGIPIGFVFGNFVEYAAHRWPMHKSPRNWLSRRMYRRHAGTHHVMFQYDDMEIRDERDLYHVMMTPAPAMLFMFVIAGIVLGGHMLGGGSFAAVTGITLCTYFFVEELMHLSFHLKSTWESDRLFFRVLRRVAEHHRIHHDTRAMREWNFNIAIPLFDWLLGTAVKTRQEGVTLKHRRPYVNKAIY